MASDRVQRQIDRLLDEAEEAITRFDWDGNYLNRWGIGAITDPHGMTIVDDVVYITDRSDHVAVKFTLDGKADEGADCTSPRSRQSTPTFNSVTPDNPGAPGGLDFRLHVCPRNNYLNS